MRPVCILLFPPDSLSSPASVCKFATRRSLRCGRGAGKPRKLSRHRQRLFAPAACPCRISPPSHPIPIQHLAPIASVSSASHPTDPLYFRDFSRANFLQSLVHPTPPQREAHPAPVRLRHDTTRLRDHGEPPPLADHDADAAWRPSRSAPASGAAPGAARPLRGGAVATDPGPDGGCLDADWYDAFAE